MLDGYAIGASHFLAVFIGKQSERIAVEQSKKIIPLQNDRNSL